MSLPIAARFRAIDGLLVQFELLWRPRPFRDPCLTWETEQPQLRAWLLNLDTASVTHLENDHTALCTALAHFFPAIAALPGLVDVPRATPQAHATPTGFDWEIAGRKWAQVRAFVDCLDGRVATEFAVPDCGAANDGCDTGQRCNREFPTIDWCSGKGHLARSIALRSGGAVLGLEYDAALCTEGARLAARDHLPVRIAHVDVLSDQVHGHLAEVNSVVALHACGRLHVRLLRLIAGNPQVRMLAIAPCCHHLCEPDDTALSTLARASPLQLAPGEMQLAVQETVTSGAARRRDRARESAWRLGFDLLQRQLRGVDEYLPVPSIPRAMLRTNFTEFVNWATTCKQLPNAAHSDLTHFQLAGEHRHEQVTRLALLRHAFRRPLELRIVCDRAQFIAEHGFTTQLLEFCPRAITPRNLLIRATRA